MFDTATAAAPVDVQAWSDARHDAWLAELIAGDPGEPAGDVLPGRLLARDPLLDAVDATRMRNLADGRVAMAVAQLLRTTSPRECLSARTLVAAEIGAALALGSGAAIKLVDAVIGLSTRLRATFAAVCAGELGWDKAVALVEWTAALTDEQAGAVERRVLAGAAGRTPARHRDALRRAVAAVDPDGADARRRKARADVALIRSHYGDGMGELFARMASEQLDTVWTAADLWARSRKADGDPRTLDQLRVAALVQWAQSLLHHGDPAYCDRWCTPGSHGGASTNDDPPAPTDERPSDERPSDERPSDERPPSSPPDEPPSSSPPTRHGRAGALHAVWDLRSLLGLGNRCGELSDSGAVLPPAAMRELVAGGVRLRRMLIDPDSGELLDLTPASWRLERTAATELDAPVVLSVIVDVTTWRSLRDGSADPDLRDAVAAAPRTIRDLLAAPWTADHLDATPTAYPVPARLAEFVAARDRHPTHPTAGPTAAAAADIDHTISVRDGGSTARDNTTALTRRWHRLKTHGGWTVHRISRHWQWTSPRGHTYRTRPYDYRLGP